MKYFDKHFQSLAGPGESAIVFGAAGGRVNFYPIAKWLYSLRFFFLWYKFEILWTTGEDYACKECEAVPLHADDSSLFRENEFERPEQGSSEGVH